MIVGTHEHSRVVGVVVGQQSYVKLWGTTPFYFFAPLPTFAALQVASVAVEFRGCSNPDCLWSTLQVAAGKPTFRLTYLLGMSCGGRQTAENLRAASGGELRRGESIEGLYEADKGMA